MMFLQKKKQRGPSEKRTAIATVNMLYLQTAGGLVLNGVLLGRRSAVRGGVDATRGPWRRRTSSARSGKLYRARSRLYRGQILQQNMRLKALVEIYTMHSFAQLCNLTF